MFCEQKRRGPLLFAHRGYHLEAPENSLLAFGSALDRGADALEMDVRMTRDGEVVVAHDADGLRTAGQPARIVDITSTQLAGWDLRQGQGRSTGPGVPVRVPRFLEVLQAFPHTPLNVDVKQVWPDMVGPLTALIAAHGASERVLLTSFSTLNLQRLRAIRYEGPLGLSRLGVLWALLQPRVLSRGAGARRSWSWAAQAVPGAVRGCRRMQIPVRARALRLDNRETIEQAHRLGYLVDYWVVDDPRVAERLLDLGADGIVTDDVPAIAAVFGAHLRTRGYRAGEPALASASSARTVGSSR